ncbi:alternate-type signal peptide domain-containing protein [Georgenia wutianyii]|uniref:Alternate-type signal peptide domain-containing protein n=1 Tax=Georgenia wutianyii TaxID=2585135 RepID=A0ABX5VMP1_9MICO|nr:alternate-type signal peptide domain-containing protein [Georgenia wutianyii]QDB79742.1 alternate-type signal peptide domain-containing protein [Georgenia wutianyii]
MPSRLTRAAVAAGLATVLLSGGGTTLAGWNDAEQRDLAAVSAGELSVEPLAAATVVLRPGTTQPLPAGTALVPGDVVRVTSTVRVAASGDLLTGRLALDTTALRGLGGATVIVTTPLPGAGPHRWTVTPEHDGARTTAVVELTVPAGLPQHTTLDAGALRWTLTQEMP